MTGKRIKAAAVLSGIFAGFWLGFLFYAIQKLTNIRLYDFLLNIDFLPLPAEVTHNVIIQWTLHLFISLLLAFLLVKTALKRKTLLIPLSFGINLAVSLTFFPLESAAEEKIIAPTVQNFGIWAAGHMIYAWVLASSIKRIMFTQK
ncbi:hypothetical protein ACFFJY_12120 [Fictibacillus aquaticus]|uniref:DUF1440 domain-containing protein n=1 Tax=Fictibacillus aquaticus TaxID=2021314 RepID=A0A235FC88_9BACL|nr:hypothetical protein [Fictibacillus aquaticus]OYD58990.1 hypothetical protein CGZ90_03560 [Fictibacillus aquaticus]